MSETELAGIGKRVQSHPAAAATRAAAGSPRKGCGAQLSSARPHTVSSRLASTPRERARTAHDSPAIDATPVRVEVGPKKPSAHAAKWSGAPAQPT